jgi:hypothetical protein
MFENIDSYTYLEEILQQYLMVIFEHKKSIFLRLSKLLLLLLLLSLLYIHRLDAGYINAEIIINRMV